MMMMKILLRVVAVLSLGSVIRAQDTCLIDNVTFQRGAAVDFQTRCGVQSDFPCFCNPDLEQQIDCPFCGFATAIPDLLRCARDGQSITLIGLEGTGQTCTCDASEPGNPVGTCVDNPSAAVCSISLPDGSKIERLPGQEIGRESRCGATSEYPCFCNPSLPGQIECPFCSFPLPNDDLLCLADGEDRLFIGSDDTARSCSCVSGETAAFPMVPTCEDLPPIGPGAMCNFTGSNGVPFQVNHGASLHEFFPNTRCSPAADYPCFCHVQLPNQMDCPYCAIPLAGGGFACGGNTDVIPNLLQDNGSTADCQCLVPNAFSDPELDCGTFPTPAPEPGCLVDLPNGQQELILTGMPVTSNTSPCGATFPYICNTALQTADNLEFPYCEFDTVGGGKACAKDSASVTFNNVDGKSESCDCIYVNSALGAQSTCSVAKDPTAAPVASPTLPPVTTVRGTSGAVRMNRGYFPTMLVGLVGLVMAAWKV
jgi:hypothetical protein